MTDWAAVSAMVRQHRESIDQENVCRCGHQGDWPKHVVDQLISGGWTPKSEIEVIDAIRRHREEIDEPNVCICGHFGFHDTHLAEKLSPMLGWNQLSPQSS